MSRDAIALASAFRAIRPDETESLPFRAAHGLKKLEDQFHGQIRRWGWGPVIELVTGEQFMRGRLEKAECELRKPYYTAILTAARRSSYDGTPTRSLIDQAEILGYKPDPRWTRKPRSRN